VPVYALGDVEPDIHPEAYVHPDAVVIGNVAIGPESTVWPTAVLRGDDGAIRIGARTSIQDGSVIHCTRQLDTVIGDECTIGHIAHLEGCTVDDGALVGTGAIVLHRAVIGPGALVAANAVVLNDTQIPPGALAMGVPAKVREGASDPERLLRDAETYVERGKRCRTEMRRID